MTPAEKIPLWPHIITALLTILIQVAAASYVYGQLSAVVAAHSKELDEMKRDKLDAAIYFREHPSSIVQERRAP